VGCYGEYYKTYEGSRLKSFGFVVLGAKDAYKDLVDSDADAEETTEDGDEPQADGNNVIEEAVENKVQHLLTREEKR
jgi:hypothetical protein